MAQADPESVGSVGGFLLLGGRAADLSGRKRLFLAGVSLFTLASLVSPAALSIIMTTFAEGPDRARALGVRAAIAGGGGAVRDQAGAGQGPGGRGHRQPPLHDARVRRPAPRR
jgi:MFS family permease